MRKMRQVVSAHVAESPSVRLVARFSAAIRRIRDKEGAAAAQNRCLQQAAAGKMKRVLTALIVLLFIFIFAGCARVPRLTKPAPNEGAASVEVEGECTAQLVNGGQSLVVAGTCNLMNGTNGIVSILNANGTTIDRQKFTKESDSLNFEFDVGNSWSGTVYGFISFDTQQCDRQPDEVTAAYGKRFQNLDGPNVIWDAKGVIAVFQSEAVEISANA